MDFKISETHIRPKPKLNSPTGVDSINNNFNNEKKRISIEYDAVELIEKIEEIMKENKNNDDKLLINKYLESIITIINVNKNICSAEKVRVTGLNNKLITEKTLKDDCEKFVTMMSELNKIILLKNNNKILDELKNLIVRYEYNFFFFKKNIDIGSKVKGGKNKKKTKKQAKNKSKRKQKRKIKQKRLKRQIEKTHVILKGNKLWKMY